MIPDKKMVSPVLGSIAKNSIFFMRWILASLVGASLLVTPAQARDELKIVGSGTVFPYANAVSKAYASRYKMPVPEVEAGASGNGIKRFCTGVGEKFPDIANASRPMKLKEWMLCKKNGVTDVSEVKFGSDGVALVTSVKNIGIRDLSRLQIYRAISQYVPVNGIMVRNPYRRWKEIDPALPDTVIQIYGPQQSHGTYSVMTKILLRDTCMKEVDYFRAIENNFGRGKEYERQLAQYCSKPRSDGTFIGLSAGPEQLLKLLEANRRGFYFIGYAVLFANRDKLRAISINGVEPRIYTISDKSYILSRPLFFYIKNAHRKLVPGLNGYVKEFMSSRAMDTFGYLTRLGLGGLSIEELKDAQYAVAIGSKMRRFEGMEDYEDRNN